MSRRPMQSILTIIQVALAVACMVSVASYRMNVSTAVDRFKSCTDDIVIAMGGMEKRTEGGYMRNMYNIFDDDDIAQLNAEVSLVESVTVYEDMWEIEADVDGTLYRIGLGALVGPGYQDVVGFDMIEGNFITDVDMKAQSRVVVISEALAKILFGEGPYVDRTLGIMPVWARRNFANEDGAMPVAPTEYHVIGVYSNSKTSTSAMSSYSGMHPAILCPLTSDPNQIYSSGQGWLCMDEEYYPYGTLMIKAAPGKAAAVRDRIVAMVSGRPSPDSLSGSSGSMVVMGGGSAEFDGPGSDGEGSDWYSPPDEESGASVIFERTDDLEQMIGSSMTRMTLLLGGATLIAIIVSALGIQSAMMVNVTERTREIGLRRVLGASRRFVVVQFTVDAMILAAVGGAFGGLLSFALYPYLMNSVFSSMGPGWLLDVSARPVGWAILAGIVLAAAVGALFGAIPAAQAARVQPADIVREL